MRLGVVGLVLLALAGCGRAPDDAVSDAATNAAGVAFAYDYGFRLPSARIADAQDAHARACERLGPPRCRITGMTYRVDDAGTVGATLQLRLAAPIARGFGRESVKAVEAAGGALVGAEITGTDQQPATDAAAGSRTSAGSDVAQLTRELARTDLPAAERATLRTQLEAAAARAREAAAAAATARESVATTTMGFTYRAGRGVGIAARVSDAGGTLAASTAATLGFALTALATLGPPALLLGLLFLLWYRCGRRLWARMLGPAD